MQCDAASQPASRKVVRQSRAEQSREARQRERVSGSRAETLREQAELSIGVYTMLDTASPPATGHALLASHLPSGESFAAQVV